MRIIIRKRSYAKGWKPWSPYVDGFWRNLINKRVAYANFYWLGYDIAVWKI